MLVLLLATTFAQDYRQFLASPRSESVFVGLTRGSMKIENFHHDPVVLWYWRTVADDAQADSLIKRYAFGRNFHLSGVLRWEARDATAPEAALDKLRLGVHLDSVSVENALSLAAAAVRLRRPSVLAEILMLDIGGDFRNQVFFFVNGAILLLGTMLLAAVVFVMAKTARYLPVLSHRMDPFGHTRIRGLLPLIVLLMPALMFRHLYVLLVVYGLLVLLVLSGRERGWLRTTIGLLIVGAIAAFPVRSGIAFLDGSSRTHALYQMIYHDDDPLLQPRSPEEKEVVAYALKQRGRLETALSLYEDLYRNGYRSVGIVNNLANLYAESGENERAATMYLTLADRGRGEPYFNLGLLRLKMIEYTAAADAMEQARRLGFSSLATDPVDILPKNQEFWGLTMEDATVTRGYVNLLLVIPLLLMFVFSFLPVRLAPPYFCDLCGEPVCAKCQHEAMEEVMCDSCHSKMESTNSEDIEQDLRQVRSRGKRIRTGALSVILNLLVPGAGLIYSGRDFLGLAAAALTSGAFFLLFFRGHFVVPTGWVTTSLTPLVYAISGVLIVVAYIVSFSFLRSGNGD